MTTEPTIPTQDDNQIIAERRAKLSALRAQGIAFPNDFRRADYAQDLQDAYADAERWSGEALEGEGRRVGLFVDDLLGQQQVVIKSLETNYRRVEGVSGATILGDGSVALILDVPGLIRVATERLAA